MNGVRVLVTSPGGEALSARLLERGAVPVHVPTIGVRPAGGAELDRALTSAVAYDWIVVTNANGVAAVFDRLRALGLPAPAGPRWAAVGPRTAAALEAEGVDVAYVPAAGAGAAIPAGMGEVSGRRVLLARARVAGRDLPEILRAAGAEVDEVTAYETVEGPEGSRERLARALDDGVDAAIFTSGSTARGFVRLAGGPERLGGAIVICIGASTAAAAARAGFAADAVAAEPTPAGLVAALETALHERNRSPEATR